VRLSIVSSSPFFLLLLLLPDPFLDLGSSRSSIVLLLSLLFLS
jgi:hypothetical protein